MTKDARELLTTLVGIPSVNPMGEDERESPFLETELTAFLEDWLRSLDVEVERQRVFPGRDNLYATYRAPSPERHLLLEVHQDTVPVKGMTIEPFAATVENGRLHGRGACDNKGPMTAMLLALARLARERPGRSDNVTLALTVDEEWTFRGASALVESGRTYDMALVAEPTELDIVVAHKGVVRWTVHSTGIACHSSTPNEGVNAIYRMAHVIRVIESHASELAGRGDHPLLGPSTISVGKIHGGIAANIVPDACWIEVDRRLLPGETPSGAMNEAARAVASVGPNVTFSSPIVELPALDDRQAEPVERRLAAALTRHGRTPRRKGVAFGTDASVYARAGIPSVVFGPGSIAQAHTKDEWIDLEQLDVAIGVYHDFCVRE